MTACGLCGAPGARLYPCGPRCSTHTPAALAGRREPGASATPCDKRHDGRAAYDEARAASMSARLRLPLPTDEQEQLVAAGQHGKPIETVPLPEEARHG